MTTSRVDHNRQHELIEQTLHEIRGGVKWLREEMDGVTTRLDRLEDRVGSLESKVDVMKLAMEGWFDQVDQVLRALIDELGGD